MKPLDQGIIASFKAAYRSKYAENIVKKFNSTGKAPPKLDILETIYLVAAAWDESRQDAPVNDNFIQNQNEAVRELVHELDGSLLPHELDEIVEEYLGFDEDVSEDIEERIEDVPTIKLLIQDAISKGIFEHGVDDHIRKLEKIAEEQEPELPPSKPIINHRTALEHPSEFTAYFQSLEVEELDTSIVGKPQRVQIIIDQVKRIEVGITRYNPLFILYIT
ncbi:Tigger transposable element-derived protein 4 [Rhizina undulata]